MKIHDWPYTSLEPIANQWMPFGWASPTYVALPSHFPKLQTQLYHLIAALNHVNLKLPAQLNYKFLDIQACIMSLFGILYSGETGIMNIMQMDQFTISAVRIVI